MDGGSEHCTGGSDQDHPQEKEMQKAKWFSVSEIALQIPVKRREVKGKGEEERHTNLNAEFQRIARRDKKAFSETTYFELKTTLGAEYRERQGN